MSSNFGVFERKIHSKSLEVNHHEINKDSGYKLVDIGQMATIKSLLKSPDFIFLGNKRVE